MNVTLTKELDRFVSGQLKEGHYPSSDAMIIEGLHPMLARELKLKNLRVLLNEGINSELLPRKKTMENIREDLF